MSPASDQLRSFAAASHYAFVRERLRGLGVAASDLDDATQDVFEVLVRRIADYDPDRPIRAWMAGIARRVARRYRDRGRRPLVPLEDRGSCERSPEDRAAEAEARAVLQRFLAELEPERWSVFVLSEIEGLRGSEIAVELGINQNTVYARLRSARHAFERMLQRHRARGRRATRAIAIWPWRWSVGRQVAVVSLGLGTTATLALGGVSCGEESREPTPDLVASAQRSSPEPRAERVAGPSILARRSDPATMRTSSTADPERWHGAGSSFANDHNLAGEDFDLSVENRYRLDGDRVIYERTYIGDDDVAIDSVETTLTFDGLELLDGEREWEIELAPGETKVVTVTLRATREGVVELHVSSAHGSRRHKWVVEHGQLRRCGERECEAPKATAESLSGERIRVHVHNECEVVKEFVLFAGYPDLLPPDAIPIHALQPDEHRIMEIDAKQWFLNRGPDGHVGGGVQTDEDGAHVTFSGTGDECSSMSTRSPSLPAGLGPPLAFPE